MVSEKLGKRKRWWLLFVFVGAGLVIAGGFYYTKTRSLEWQTKRLFGCIEARDAECLMQYATKEEIRESDLTTAKVQEFLDRIVEPRLSGYKFEGLKVEQFGPPDVVADMVVTELVKGDDRVAASVSIFPVDGHYKIFVIPTLYYMVLKKGWQPDASLVPAAENLLAHLERLQIKKMIYASSQGHPPAPSWYDRFLMFLHLKPRQEDPHAGTSLIFLVGPSETWRDVVDRFRKDWAAYLKYKESQASKSAKSKPPTKQP